MALTIKFLTDSFKTFNAVYFKNELLKPRFEITHVKSYLGQYHWKYSHDSRIFLDSVIRISDYYMRDETELQQTLLHEMIHLYIRQNKIRDTRPHHGMIFNSIADRLNREGGFHIARTDSVEGCGLRNKTEVKTYHVICYKTRNGKYFQFVINKSYLDYYINRIENNPYHFKDAYIFTSTDDKRFAHYPACRNGVRGYYIEQKVFNEQKSKERVINRFVTLGIRHDAA